LWLAIALIAATSASCTQSPTTSSGGSSTTASTTPIGTDSAWVKDSTDALNVFLPDQDSIYWFDGYGTANGARTVVTGQVPTARYWSFTAYPCHRTVNANTCTTPRSTSPTGVTR
jgi:hypothetical protein